MLSQRRGAAEFGTRKENCSFRPCVSASLRDNLINLEIAYVSSRSRSTSEMLVPRDNAELIRTRGGAPTNCLNSLMK